MEYMKQIAIVYGFTLAVITTVYGYGILITDIVKWICKKVHKTRKPEQEQQDQEPEKN